MAGPLLPEGTLDSWGLKVKHHILEDAGAFSGGGWKICWHTTEGANLDGAVSTLASARSAAHFVIDPKSGDVTQCVPLDQAARSLEHPSGPETNRANVIQIEVVGFSTIGEAQKHGAPAERAVPNFDAAAYRRLAALAVLIEHRHPVPRHARPFRKPEKFTGQGFVDFAGHCGHVHVPGNSHTDPGQGFDWPTLVDKMKSFEREAAPPEPAAPATA
jgi:N-acetyl-anhydromuramyl-L-alanine amidase AmpD